MYGGRRFRCKRGLDSPLCSRNARPMKALVGRAQFGANKPLFQRRGKRGKRAEQRGYNKGLMLAQVASLAFYNMEEGRKEIMHVFHEPFVKSPLCNVDLSTL